MHPARVCLGKAVVELAGRIYRDRDVLVDVLQAIVGGGPVGGLRVQGLSDLPGRGQQEALAGDFGERCDQRGVLEAGRPDDGAGVASSEGFLVHRAARVAKPSQQIHRRSSSQ
jgi:hypothetical protein